MFPDELGETFLFTEPKRIQEYESVRFHFPVPNIWSEFLPKWKQTQHCDGDEWRICKYE